MTSISQKYARLPDIDLDQKDVYETPDLPDDISTVPETTASEGDDEDIERQGLQIDAARERFAKNKVDADNADFSDTLIARQKKQSYQTSTLLESEGTTNETLDQKIARVRREMEEIRLEMMNDQKPSEEIVDWEELIHSFQDEKSPSSLLTQRLQRLSSPNGSTSGQQVKYTLSYNPGETTQFSNLSSRISTLESLLGLPLTSSSTPILPTLTHLTTKLNLLTSPSHIDSFTQRIKQLTTDLTTLEEKREQSRQRALLDPEDLTPQQGASSEEELAWRIDALYAALQTIDRIGPVLPGVIERLRGMRVVHADAAGVVGGLKEMMERIGKMEGEVQSWEAGVGRVEAGKAEVQGRVLGVVEKVEEVVKGLETRVSQLPQ